MPTHIEIVQAIFEDFAVRGSIDALMAHVADDVIYTATVPPGTPVSGELHGREGIQEYFRAAFESMDVSEVRFDGVCEMDGKVVVTGSERMLIRATGEACQNDFCAIMTFRGDQITRVHLIEDHSLLYAWVKAEAARAK